MLLTRKLRDIFVTCALLSSACAFDSASSNNAKLTEEQLEGVYGSIPSEDETLPQCLFIHRDARSSSKARQRFWYVKPGDRNQPEQALPWLVEKLPLLDRVRCFGPTPECISRRHHTLARVRRLFGVGPTLLEVEFVAHSSGRLEPGGTPGDLTWKRYDNEDPIEALRETFHEGRSSIPSSLPFRSINGRSLQTFWMSSALLSASQTNAGTQNAQPELTRPVNCAMLAGQSIQETPDS